MIKNNEYTPIRDMLLMLNRLVETSGMSLREVARKLEDEGMNLYNVCAMANGKPEALATVKKFDTYIGGILRVTGRDEYDLIHAVMEELENPNPKQKPPSSDHLSVELREFLRSPDAEKYVTYAYNKYRLDKLEKEREELKKILSEDL